MIQIRDIPDELHGKLKARAARAGMTLSDYLKKELERSAELPTLQEWLERVHQAPPIRAGKTAAEIIRELRDAQ